MNIPERYSKQVFFPGIGAEGQRKIGEARVAVMGTGALGTVIANNLARAGVGYLRLIDRDFVESSDLQRQILFSEEDVLEHIPKAVAAAEHLKRVNSEIFLEAAVTDVNPANIEKLIGDVDLVMDGTDNFETRFLLNDACVKAGIPWIYGRVTGSTGVTLNIIPGKTPCLRCLSPNIPAPGSQPTFSTAGVLNMTAGMIGCYETAEALKYLVKSPTLRAELLQIDVWNNSNQVIRIDRNMDCPVCVHGEYEFLDGRLGSCTTSLCGSDAYQIVPQFKGEIDLKSMKDKLSALGEVICNRFLLRFSGKDLEIVLFSDGRAMIMGAPDPNIAKSIYSQYIGL
jgi:adenylyltransferase/sulfurtransferase